MRIEAEHICERTLRIALRGEGDGRLCVEATERAVALTMGGVRYEVTLPRFIDDEPIEVRQRAASEAATREAPAQVELTEALLGWLCAAALDARREQALYRLLSALPAGDYDLIHSPLAPRASGAIDFGNIRLPAPARALELLDEDAFYGALFGPEPWRGARGAVHLGLALRFFNPVVELGVYFFAFEAAAAAAPEEGLILVLPRSEPFLMGCMGALDGAERAATRGVIDALARRLGAPCSGGQGGSSA